MQFSMPQYLLRIAQENLTFRLPHLYSIADVFNFELKIVSTDLYRGALVVELEDEKHLQQLLDRGLQIMWAAELFAEGSSYDELHTVIRGQKQSSSRYAPFMNTSFRFSVEGTNHRISNKRTVETVQSFAYLDFQGDIKMRDAEIEWIVFEDYDLKELNTPEERLAYDGHFQRVYFGRRIDHSRARTLMTSHAVKRRVFFGNTSMEAEMGFLMASQALPAPGKIVYDPFAGTGSLLYSCAHWGTYVMASDIDGRQMRGKGKGKDMMPGMLRAAAQYGVADKFLGMMCYDVTLNPIRRGGWIDAIVTDPPYGVRAGAKRLGKKDKRPPARDEPFVFPDGRVAHLQPGYLPPSRPYVLTHLTLDLIRLARYLLVPGGRLVFFLPTTSEEYQSIKIPQVEGMLEVTKGGVPIQDFGTWGRRMITMEKVAQDDGEPPKFTDYSEVETQPGDKTFQERYWDSFASKTNGSPAVEQIAQHRDA
ncbi:S-adenosyl-L-methionine-dependent methyltransferase [Kockovaella imperatae]|uniref:tRNA (guanine(10)-N(2))-methyltransferase n=1 Tax=Kockovaella imperatae TaxID=4999 RepID=A0A1Y1UCL0_9TREE|nr:S-adenosyl-L-methionine-dependent methyltransferase [Kockovaella imperatae]ORX34805.1 S-adenosyl-L-methionine-dependent methyltransferase [Kockovaella imperatae]